MDVATIVVSLLAGIGAFMIGFKILSENVEKLANKGLKNLFNKSTKNRFVGVGVGAVTTALVQSSSATTVMVVGFVNAGIMNLYQATSVIMGANIGTTITAQIVALQSFDFALYAMLLAFFGIFINLLAKKDKVKSIGYALAGMGLLFLGLNFMKTSMESLKDSQVIVDALATIGNPFVLLIIGIIATALVQSSAAIATILISMVGAGIQVGTGGNSILYVILGTNIGTCVTALLSSIGANANAKRASLIHLLFNVFGTILFMIILLIWTNFMDNTFGTWFPNLPATQVAMFHTFFNIICTLVFIPFTGMFVKLSRLLIKDKISKKEKLTYMDERMLEYPSVALGQLTKEISHMSFEAMEAFNLSIDDFLSKDEKNKEKIDCTNEKLEQINQEIIGYLVKISSSDVSYNDECMISSFHHNLNDIMRIGELADNITKYTKSVVKENMEFSDLVIVEIGKMRDLINQLYRFTDATFTSRNKQLMTKIDKIEESIDDMRSNLIKDHLDRLKVGKCQPQSSGVFINLVNNLERAADHLTYIAQSV